MANKLEPKYHKWDKFEIEISEVHTHYTDDGKAYNLYRVKSFNTLVFDDYRLDNLKKVKKYEEVKEETKPLNVKICITDMDEPTSDFKIGDLISIHDGLLFTRNHHVCNNGYKFCSVSELEGYFHGIRTKHNSRWSDTNMIDFVVVNEV